MKNLKLIGAALALFVMFSINSSAQGYGNGQGRGMNYDKSEMKCRIPDLTEDQEAKIKDLRMDHMKAMKDLRNQVGENRAKYRTLMSADKADMGAINKNIDDFTSIKNKMMKQRAKHKQDVRSLLTEEQRLFYDSRMGKRGKGKRGGKAHRRGMGKGYGMGQGQNCGRL